MSVRVRFAPSPTGYLHIGGLRTALYNLLFARAHGGVFILRVEDTDEERSESRYEEVQKQALSWGGIQWDEEFYRQSERSDIYQKYATKLVEEGKAFYCFCTEEELEEMRTRAELEGRPPHYDGRYRNYPLSDALERIAKGENPVIRFKAPLKPYVLRDMVRGRVVFPENMVGDFVIMRSSGQPVYNFCCVVDDWLMKITHVIRGEDHLSNTVRQLMLYEALGVGGEELPKFAHVSLLIGPDRQKLSKRHGVVSVDHYREEGFLSQALGNYLCLLGYSPPSGEEVFCWEDQIKDFDPQRFNKAAALYDRDKLRYINGRHLRLLPEGELFSYCKRAFPKDHPFHRQSQGWQRECINFFKDHIFLFREVVPLVDELLTSDVEKDQEGEFSDILGWESTKGVFYLFERGGGEASGRGQVLC